MKEREMTFDAFGKELFAVQADIGNRSMQDLLNQDIKVYEIRSIKVMIAQIMVSNLKTIQNEADQIQENLNTFAEQKGAVLMVAAFTSVLDKGSIFFSAGEKACWITEAYPNRESEAHSLQAGVLSRKSQILPRITEIIDQYA